MNRVKKIERLYIDRKPEIDRVRAIESHTRRLRRNATRVRAAHDEFQMASKVASLEKLTVKELRALAGQAEIPRRSKLTKGQLVKALAEI